MSVGDSIPDLVIEPITRSTLALYAGSGDHNPMHIDIDFAKQAGMDDVFAHGMLIMAYLGRSLQISFHLQFKEFQVRFCSITNVGDVITCKGKVMKIVNDKTKSTIVIGLNAIDKSGDIKINGTATIEK